jgi:hypothetical protein
LIFHFIGGRYGSYQQNAFGHQQQGHDDMDTIVVVMVEEPQRPRQGKGFNDYYGRFSHSYMVNAIWFIYTYLEYYPSLSNFRLTRVEWTEHNRFVINLSYRDFCLCFVYMKKISMNRHFSRVNKISTGF